MTKKETGKILLLLSQFYPAKVTDEVTLAWSLALEPFGYDEIRSAVLEYVRSNKFFPNIADITECIPKKPVEEHHCSHAEMKPFVDKLTAMCEAKQSVSRYAREHGISWEAARLELCR